MIRMISLLAAGNPIEHVTNKPWEWSGYIEPLRGYVLSSHVIMLMISASILTLFTLTVAKSRSLVPSGKKYNLLEIYVLFIRDFVAKPTLHDKAYKFLPFLLTTFAFLLVNNLLGLVPIMDISHAIPGLHGSPIGGTATGNIWITGALAMFVLALVIFSGVHEQVKHFAHHGGNPVVGWLIGFFLYLWSLVPTMPTPIKIIMAPLLIVLEFGGVVVKCCVLAIRLFANMVAGHILLAVLIGFILAFTAAGLDQAASNGTFWVVMPASVLGSVAVNMLELLVAVLQAYIFTFLAAVFLGMAVNPHH